MTPSTRSHRKRLGAEERGAATVEFTMVAALLVLLTLAAVQLGLALHVRNSLIDAASTGARFGALADRTGADGAQRTRELLDSSVASSVARDVRYEQVSTPEGEVLRITVTAELPLISALPGIEHWEVTAGAYVVE